MFYLLKGIIITCRVKDLSKKGNAGDRWGYQKAYRVSEVYALSPLSLPVTSADFNSKIHMEDRSEGLCFSLMHLPRPC